MAFPHPPGLMPSEVAFICEMELVTIIPRQRLERLDLLGGPTNPLIPPQRTDLALWLALLLKRQRRANIIPPLWLHPESLTGILELETTHFTDSFSPPPPLPPPISSSTSKTFTAAYPSAAKTFQPSDPFLSSSTSTSHPDALPYHWLELAEMLLEACPDDLVDPDTIRRLIRDLREVRMAKMRRGVEVLTGEGEGVRLDGVGAMEVAESRGFITGVVDGLRKVGASREQARREREEEEGRLGSGRRGLGNDDDEDEDMG